MATKKKSAAKKTPAKTKCNVSALLFCAAEELNRIGEVDPPLPTKQSDLIEDEEGEEVLVTKELLLPEIVAAANECVCFLSEWNQFTKQTQKLLKDNDFDSKELEDDVTGEDPEPVEKPKAKKKSVAKKTTTVKAAKPKAEKKEKGPRYTRANAFVDALTSRKTHTFESLFEKACEIYEKKTGKGPNYHLPFEAEGKTIETLKAEGNRIWVEVAEDGSVITLSTNRPLNPALYDSKTRYIYVQYIRR